MVTHWRSLRPGRESLGFWRANLISILRITIQLEIQWGSCKLCTGFIFAWRHTAIRLKPALITAEKRLRFWNWRHLKLATGLFFSASTNVYGFIHQTDLQGGYSTGGVTSCYILKTGARILHYHSTAGALKFPPIKIVWCMSRCIFLPLPPEITQISNVFKCLLSFSMLVEFVFLPHKMVSSD